jgi:hypothetical protein
MASRPADTLNALCNSWAAENVINMVTTPTNIRVVPARQLILDIALHRKVPGGDGRTVELDEEAKSALQVLGQLRRMKTKAGLAEDDIKVVLIEQHTLGSRGKPPAIAEVQTLLEMGPDHTTLTEDGIMHDPTAVAAAVGDHLFPTAAHFSLLMRAADTCDTVCAAAVAAIQNGTVQKVAALDETETAKLLTIVTVQALTRDTVWRPASAADGTLVIDPDLSQLHNPPVFVTQMYDRTNQPIGPAGLLALPQLGVNPARQAPPRHQILLLAAVDELGQLYAVVYDPTYAQFNAAAVLRRGALLSARLGEGICPAAAGAPTAYLVRRWRTPLARDANDEYLVAPDPARFSMDDIALRHTKSGGVAHHVMHWMQQQQRLRIAHEGGAVPHRPPLNLDGTSYGYVGDYGFASGGPQYVPHIHFRLQHMAASGYNGLRGRIVGPVEGSDRLKFQRTDRPAAKAVSVAPAKLLVAAPFTRMVDAATLAVSHTAHWAVVVADALTNTILVPCTLRTGEQTIVLPPVACIVRISAFAIGSDRRVVQTGNALFKVAAAVPQSGPSARHTLPTQLVRYGAPSPVCGPATVEMVAPTARAITNLASAEAKAARRIEHDFDTAVAGRLVGGGGPQLAALFADLPDWRQSNLSTARGQPLTPAFAPEPSERLASWLVAGVAMFLATNPIEWGPFRRLSAADAAITMATVYGCVLAFMVGGYELETEDSRDPTLLYGGVKQDCDGAAGAGRTLHRQLHAGAHAGTVADHLRRGSPSAELAQLLLEWIVGHTTAETWIGLCIASADAASNAVATISTASVGTLGDAGLALHQLLFIGKLSGQPRQEIETTGLFASSVGPVPDGVFRFKPSDGHAIGYNRFRAFDPNRYPVILRLQTDTTMIICHPPVAELTYGHSFAHTVGRLAPSLGRSVSLRSVPWVPPLIPVIETLEHSSLAAELAAPYTGAVSTAVATTAFSTTGLTVALPAYCIGTRTTPITQFKVGPWNWVLVEYTADAHAIVETTHGPRRRI